MAKKKEVYKVKPLNENKKNIIAALIDEYDIETADDIQAALKDLLGGTIEYSRAVTPQVRQAGNRLSGLTETAYASLLA